MKEKNRRLAEIKLKIPEIAPLKAFEMQQDGAVLIDVREADEIAQGSPVGAARLGRGFLELRIEESVTDLAQPLLVMCAGGVRSLFAAENLKNMGYENVCSIAGGFNGWKNEGLNFEVPRTLDKDARERYSRHLLVPGIGEAGQLKLMDSKVLLIGAGGIGSPASLYLAAAGVGTLGIIDHDVVDRSNLQRQVVHTESRIGTPKVASAKETLENLNPTVNIVTYEARLDSSNVEEIFSKYDVVIDGSDNLATRYLVSDACAYLKIPNVHGAVYRFEGQVTVFWPDHESGEGPCYRCLFPKMPSDDLAPSCAQSGVLGVLPGTIGLLEATEALKILLGMGTPLVGKMLYYDALESSFMTLKLKRNPDCKVCGENAEFNGFEDVVEVCSIA
ncbi:MAG: molybdopterin-synthase adenylyltransferase MoeB [Gammaproteobacteria bacterium]|nr:molybdopterin-synthase adenylyltransferase MoeB [Gammaproteobacteria bacterium]